MELPIIILNYNTPQKVIKFIESCKNHKENIKLKYIIVDNNSSDNQILFDYLKDCLYLDETSLDVSIKEYEYIYIQLNKNYGYSKANNIGIQLSRKNNYLYACLSNPDIVVLEDYSFSSLLNSMQEKTAMIFPLIVDPNNVYNESWKEPNLYRLLFYQLFYPILYIPTLIYDKLTKNNNPVKEIFTNVGCFFLLNTSHFDTIGDYDENVFLYYEEYIIASKIKKASLHTLSNKNVCILHEHSIVTKTKKQSELNLQSLRYFLKNYKHYPDWIIEMICISQKIKEKYYDPLRSKLIKSLK